MMSCGKSKMVLQFLSIHNLTLTLASLGNYVRSVELHARILVISSVNWKKGDMECDSLSRRQLVSKRAGKSHFYAH